MYGGNARPGDFGHRGGSAQRVDQVVSEVVHIGNYAEMAELGQPEICRIGICHYGIERHLVTAMTIEQIRALMKERGYHQGDLANLLGIDPTAVSKRLTGKRPFKLAEMRKVEDWLGVESTPPQLEGVAVRMLPVIGQVTAGKWGEAIQRPIGNMPVTSDTPLNSIALQVFGDSMDLEVEDGGTVIVDLDDKALFPGKLYVIMNADGETTFKQFEVDPARLVPRSSNPAHRTIQIGDGQTFTVMGRVTALHRRR